MTETKKYLIIFFLLASLLMAGEVIAGEMNIAVDREMISLTEKNTVNIKVELPFEIQDLKSLEWELEDKKISGWSKWDSDERYISIKEMKINNSVLETQLEFDLYYGEEDISFPRTKREDYPDLVGEYSLSLNKYDEMLAETEIRITPYESYRTHEELENITEKISDQVSGRYISYDSIGKSAEGRNIPLVVLARDEETVDNYKNHTLPLLLEEPEELIDKINSKNKDNDIQVPIYFTNVHPDEAPGVDAIITLMEKLALSEQISFLNNDQEEVELDVEQLLDNIIFLFSFTFNPDGRYHNLRRTVHGFDMNRDFAYQTQVETQQAAASIQEWTPITLLDFHGFFPRFMLEPGTQPYDPNLELDLFMENWIDHAHIMGEAAIDNTTYGWYEVIREYYAPDDIYDFAGWDHGVPAYLSTYSLLQGSLGHALETKELNQESHNALVYMGLASIKYVQNNKEELLLNQAENFRRSLANKDLKDKVDQWFVDERMNEVGRPRGNNDNFFPEYYVIPVDKELQDNVLEAYNMVEYLLRNGVKVEKLVKDKETGGKIWPEGTYIVPLRQARRSFANSVLYDGLNLDYFAEMYAEVVVNFHDFWGFDREVIREEKFFSGFAEEIDEIEKPLTTKETSNSKYIVHNINNDTIRAINKLLYDDYKVYWIMENGFEYNRGDFLIEAELLNMVKDKYYLEITGIDEINGDYIQLEPSKIGNVGHAQTTFVMKDLGFNLSSNIKESDLIVDDNGGVDFKDIKSGVPYIGISAYSMVAIEEEEFLTDFEFSIKSIQDEWAGIYQGLLRTNVNDNMISAGYNSEEVFHFAHASFFENVPEHTEILIEAKNDEYFKAGWWPGHEEVKEKALAIRTKYNEKTPLILFANDLTHRAHFRHGYRMLANAIYSMQLKQ